jgi:fibronectin type 3 domain-containing protein
MERKRKKSKIKSKNKKPAKKKKSVLLRRVAKITGTLAAVLLIVYFSLGFILDKGFFKRELEEKIGRVAGATTLTLRMIGPPNKPVLSATSLCQNYVAYVHLSWGADDQVDYYDVDRDGAPLVAGLVTNSYDDQTVAELSSYTYTVTAFNSLGQNTSDPVTVTVLDCGEPPPPPVLTATPVCVGEAPYINLSWTSDPQMNYFDLDRNGSLLAGNLTDTEYEDGAVTALTSYIYFVTAFTSQGQVISNTATATALDCRVPPPPPPPTGPTCVITKFQNINLAGYTGTPSTKERNPKFFGTTNMANAIIEIVVTGKTSVVATTSASQNGYWTWKPQNKLNYGTHTIWVTAIDPNDSTRRKTTSLKFKVKREEEEDEEEAEAPAPGITVPSTPVAPVPNPPAVPEEPAPVPSTEASSLNLSVQVENLDGVAFAGRKLVVETKIDITGEAAKQESELQYWIVNSNDEEVFRDSDKIFINGDMTIGKDLVLPGLLKPGEYKILVDVVYKDTRFIAEDTFTLKEIPLMSLGAGITLTAGQIMRNLFWVILWLLILLLIFLTLLAIEHWTSQRAIIQITEETFRDKGLIRKNKIS